MGTFEYRLDLYEYLAAKKEAILAEAGQIGESLNIPAEIKGKFGTTGANSSLPGSIRRDMRTSKMVGRFAPIIFK